MQPHGLHHPCSHLSMHRTAAINKLGDCSERAHLCTLEVCWRAFPLRPLFFYSCMQMARQTKANCTFQPMLQCAEIQGLFKKTKRPKGHCDPPFPVAGCPSCGKVEVKEKARVLAPVKVPLVPGSLCPRPWSCSGRP